MTLIRYLDIQRMSSEDGPGLRTTIFFQRLFSGLRLVP